MELESADCLASFISSQLTLDELRDISLSRKGKARNDTPLTDEEIAFRLFEEENLAVVESLRLAFSLQHAIDVDQDILAKLTVEELGAADDHRYAQALSLGQALPKKSDAQKALEDLESQSEASPLPNIGGSKPFRVDCVICAESFRSSTIFQAPCRDYYCLACLCDLVRACIGDESLFPLRCCQQSLPVTDFNDKSHEFETLANNRVYCCNLTCSQFLGSSASVEPKGNNMLCSECATWTCTLCKQHSHPSESCAENTALLELKALATEKHWQTCPQCSSIIELNIGCYHMTCRCHMQFCYLCAAPWKTCTCPQWEENRLFNAAEVRVEREFGAAARVAEPVVFQRRVEQRAQELRQYHDCNPHRWKHCPGGGTCEECGHFLPLYLKGCRNCQIMVCVRCMRNRL
ncbi:hypothetical protein J3R30DRAFT_3653919 [Lentinula aciculospora]|uniref:RBR-type E3 ubiquitin transferase n=1 Tax=Lentinula aciculospora TaxID=153920 RepID=A0A9W9AWC4_9AGAR|nr:hypothetical protein J3R30DRAFT_3653919 [Lentinula aciculospora]